MSNLTNTKTAKSLGLVVALAVAAMMFWSIAIPVAHGVTLAELVELFIALEIIPADKAEQARAVLTQQEAPAASGVCPYTWTRSLTTGDTGDDVMKLQQFLNADSATRLASSGPGSPGNETSYFGSITASGVVKFQNMYASEVLAPIGLSSGTGFFGTMSRAKANDLCAVAAAPSGPTAEPTGPEPTAPAAPTVPAGTGLLISKAANQPANSLAPINATRVPFTKVVLTAGSDGAVTVNSLQVELIGLGDDSDFDGVVLMNEDGTLIGIPKTLDSNDQAKIGTAFTIPAGGSKTVVVGGNIASSVGSGTTVGLNVIGVNTSATVTGTLPIGGATHTLNDTLTIGSISTLARGSLDPGSGRTEEVGKTDFNFAGVKFTAGSVEDVLVKSIRWNQSGSVSPEDLENVKTVIDGMSYDTMRDGDFYLTVFPGDGLLMQKGFSKDFTVRGDIVGGSSRTIDFDLERREDVHMVGTKFGYGIRPSFGSDSSGTDDGAFHTTNNPYYDAFQHTVSAGTLQVSSWTQGVPAQNIAENVTDQPLLGFTVDVDGEPVTVGTITVDVNVRDGSANTSDLTNLVLVDENGAVIAGPQDGSGSATTQRISFSDTVTFPVGLTNVFLKGKLSTDFGNNDTVSASTTPSSWSTVTGDVTGDTVTPSPTTGSVDGPTLTVKAGDLSLTVSSQPPGGNVVAGSSNFEFARYILDASQSGENVRVTALPFEYNFTGMAPTILTNCLVRDGIGATAPELTTGGNVVNPAASDASADDLTFTFDNSGITVLKGTSKTLSLRCDVSASATSSNTVIWSLDSSATYSGITGLVSGESISSPTVSAGNEQTMTVAGAGTFSVFSDTSVLYKVVQAGSTDVVLGKFRFEADTSEDIDLKQLAFQLGATASNSPADLVGQKVSIWNGSTKVGEAQFGLTSGDNATSTLDTPVRINAGELVTLTVKGDLSSHNATYLSASNLPGQFLQVDWDANNTGLNGNYATGVQSGAVIGDGSGEITTTSDVTTNGMRIFRTVPTVEDVTTKTALVQASELYRLKITAGSGRDVLLRRLAFDIATTGAVVDGFNLYGPSGAVKGTNVTVADQLLAGTYLGITFDDTNVDRLIPAGTSKEYYLKANTVTGLTSNNTESLNVNLRADTAYTATTTRVTTVFDIEGGDGAASTTDNFIWSPNSTTTPEATAAKNHNNDWTNGYGISGYPGIGQDFSARVFTD